MFPLVPNQTLYSLDCSRGEEAFALSAILNSTIVDALCLDVAERAKDDHFRFLAATVAAAPMVAGAPRSAGEAPAPLSGPDKASVPDGKLGPEERLERLERLHKKGLISDGEYKKRREEILKEL